MTKTIMIPLAGFALAALVGCSDGGAYPSANNQAPSVTPYVQDLVGARGRDGEGRLEERGFRWVKTQKTDDSSYTFWQHRTSGQCLSVRTLNGRYDALVKTPAFDCQNR